MYILTFCLINLITYFILKRVVSKYVPAPFTYSLTLTSPNQKNKDDKIGYNFLNNFVKEERGLFWRDFIAILAGLASGTEEG